MLVFSVLSQNKLDESVTFVTQMEHSLYIYLNITQPAVSLMLLLDNRRALHMVPTVLENPRMSWNLNFVLECPGKSLNLGEFEILSLNVLENIKVINET